MKIEIYNKIIKTLKIKISYIFKNKNKKIKL